MNRAPSGADLFVDVYNVCTLQVDPSVIPKERFSARIGVDGLPYFDIKYDLLMTIQSASILFEFEVGGTVYRDVKASYHVR